MKDIFSLEFPRSTPGQIIRAHRKNFGLTLKDLEKATGIAESNLSAIENDRTEIGTDRAHLIGAALGIDPEFILLPPGYESRFQKKIALVRAAATKIIAQKAGTATSKGRRKGAAASRPVPPEPRKSLSADRTGALARSIRHANSRRSGKARSG